MSTPLGTAILGTAPLGPAQLARLLRVLEKTEMHKAMFHMGFPVASGEHAFHVDRIEFTREGLLRVAGTQRRGAISHACSNEHAPIIQSYSYGENHGRKRSD